MERRVPHRLGTPRLCIWWNKRYIWNNIVICDNHRTTCVRYSYGSYVTMYSLTNRILWLSHGLYVDADEVMDEQDNKSKSWKFCRGEDTPYYFNILVVRKIRYIYATVSYIEIWDTCKGMIASVYMMKGTIGMKEYR